MGKIFFLAGKSSSGKDTIYRSLLECESLGLNKLIPYTTRPIRAGEMNGREYFFTEEAGLEKLRESGRVIEERVYHTYHGPWYYFTVDDGQLDLAKRDYLMIGTLESFLAIRKYVGGGSIVPLYIEGMMGNACRGRWIGKENRKSRNTRRCADGFWRTVKISVKRR